MDSAPDSAENVSTIYVPCLNCGFFCCHPQTPYLSIKGTARVEEGGAPELLDQIAKTIFGPGTGFPPPNAPPGYLTHITIDKVGGVGPWAT